MRVAILGATGKGNYGHQVDQGFANRSDVEICAVADEDETGRLEAMKRLSVERGYRDYADLLREERPDIVAVTPRFPDGHFAMVTAALRAGCHVYCEKPLAVDLHEADSMVEMADRLDLRLAIALPFVHEPRFRQVSQLLDSNTIGRIVHLRAFTKCDGRGGGQELAVLGPHLFDMMRRFGGNPVSCTARVGVGAQPARHDDVKDGDERVGLIAGDCIIALYVFQNGLTGTIESLRTRDLDTSHQPYRLEIYGDQGVIAIRAPYGDHGIWLSSVPYAGFSDESWRRLPTSAILSQGAYHALAVPDFIEAIKDRRDPLASGRDGLWALEMSHAVYASHFAGEQVRFPLPDRLHPLKKALEPSLTGESTRAPIAEF